MRSIVIRYVFIFLFGFVSILEAETAQAQEYVPMYTWFSATRGDHFTTSNPEWAGRIGDIKQADEGSGYVLTRIEGQVLNPSHPQPRGTVALYSFWNPARADNFLTSDSRWVARAERDGYTRFRLEGYIYPAARPGMLPLRSFWSAYREDNFASTDPRLAITINSSAEERTMSVEGGRYIHYRVEGYMQPPSGPSPSARPTALRGLVDMHAHPMSHLGFGKKLIHGAPDVGSLIPAGTRDCNAGDIRATSISQALGHDNSTHGGPGPDNGCGDHRRNLVLNIFESANEANRAHGSDKTGWPTFLHWPKHNDITHQQMWVDWIKRARENGMRIMVALAVNNKTLATALKGDPPLDDRGSADLQIREIRAFVNRHRDFMEIAASSADLRRIVRSGRLAVVLGIEIDDLGNFDSTEGSISQAAINAEVNRLRSLGVRYVFPIHLTNNRFGGAAVYEPFFNVLNRLQHGGWFDLECSSTVGWRHDSDISGLLSTFSLDRPFLPNCREGQGHRNRLGLTSIGHILMDALMRRGMLIDIDHMSERSVDDALDRARKFPSGWGYPLVSGHNGLRGSGGLKEV